MKARNIENNLALVGALIVLVGVSFAAEDALGVEFADVTSTAIAIHDVANSTTSGAAQANADSAALAAKSLARANWIDLDIKLNDHRSTLIADEK
ncbi:MAG: hypothetical protein KC572_00315 [Gammaproteobacteria bacterium]|nr:hypothetical protein [Gammaproteobacteria bacterium]